MTFHQLLTVGIIATIAAIYAMAVWLERDTKKRLEELQK